jgi:hypothetical protein
MKNQRLSIAIVVAVLISICGLIGLQSRRSAAQNTKQNDHDALRDALRRGGLREAARLKGHYVEDFDPHWDFGAFSLESLTRNCETIVVGVLQDQLRTRITDEGLVIVTDYEVLVQEVIKGGGFRATTINVSLPGGRVEFDDGTSAELRTPTFEHPKHGGTYVFFLTERKHEPNTFNLTGGPQGLVEFVGNRVKSHGRASDPIAKQKNDTDKEGFLRELRESAKKWPKKEKCCQ